MTKKIRDVVYGFVILDEQECAIIDHPVFQRLRRIRQLSLTDMVYPGATHTRFEHSIGVMQMATDMFDCIINNNKRILEKEYSLDETGIKRARKVIRLAALLHDIGHAPFSHSGEDLMPLLPPGHIRYVENGNKKYEHEEYSIAIIKNIFQNLIEKHRINNNFHISVEDVTALLGDPSVKVDALSLLWKELISGQIDADRADYLLRDSIHLGVNYGLYDRNRLINCLTLGHSETGDLILAIEEKSWHIAESLVLARYQMFSQVYFHKVRRIYDYHIQMAVKEILKYKRDGKGVYPTPDELDEYLSFDDWEIYSGLKQHLGGAHGDIILERKHFKCIFQSQLIPTDADEKEIEKLKEQYKDTPNYLDDKASTLWYKLDKDIIIYGNKHTQPLSEKSAIVKAMSEKTVQKRFYVAREIS
ncbi:HD domain-containing protein [Christensenellaceae bacterium NSJ-63]|uniref:HD domain-containing protein n=1 Tax=Guopingia tenuis TaxID=2763656 RepID=A0A926DL49_9FIRM|nr:HD domain-containing protein [Guopingia tenuis]MBC8539219.1 HD domain-containing protein [Guopingia tenuis]